MEVFIVGYASGDKYIKEILDGVKYQTKIGMQSPVGQVLKHLTKISLRKKGKKISTYKRLYCLVGDNIQEELHDAEERFYKKLAGKAVSDVIGQYPIEILDSISEEIVRAGKDRISQESIIKLQRYIHNLAGGFERELKRYQSLRNDSWYLFRGQEYAANYISEELKKFRETSHLRDDMGKIKKNVEREAGKNSWI